MYAVVGLGNVGKRYSNTFHNTGFLVLDLLAQLIGASFSNNSLLESECALAQIDSMKVILAKPTTFMNLSGMAASAIVNFYKIDIENLIVVRDDIDMEIGKIKIKKNSSSGGHKGVQSIIDRLSSNKFIQVKLGIGREINVSHFVLEKIDNTQGKVLFSSAQIACQAILEIIRNGWRAAANQFNNNKFREFENGSEKAKN